MSGGAVPAAALAWGLLAAAVLLAPLGDPTAERLRTLRVRGRFAVADGRHRGDGTARSRFARVALRPSRLVPSVAVAAGSLAAARAGAALGIAAATAAATAALLASDLARRRAAARSEQLLRLALRAVVGELVAGAFAPAALRAAESVDPSRADIFEQAAVAAEHGEPVADALAGVPELAGLARAWAVAADTGAPVADVLARLLADLEARLRARRELAGLLAGPRSSAVLLAVLPLLGVALGASMGAAPVAFLFGSPVGRAVCVGGVLLDAAGVLWTRRLAANAEPA